MNEVCGKLRSLLEDSVRRNLTDGILLSGGLDTSILACIASKYGNPKTFTVGFKNAPAPDIEYARIIATCLNLEHHVYVFGENQLYNVIRDVIRVIKSFDPMEIRNDTTIYIGLKYARDNGIATVMTGDGSDELFAGYSFFFELTKECLDSKLEKLWNTMRFSCINLAKDLGVEVRLPYLDPEFKEYTMKIDSGLKVRVECGTTWGKWILRKAFEDILPKEVVWRVKTPIEMGSGTTVLPALFSSTISDEEFEVKKQKYLIEDKVTIRDKEQLYYYEAYRSIFGVPGPENVKDKTCPYCNSTILAEVSFCRTCGAYLV
ncbi:MAG: asparagine synthase C-terminal domain-containing protein [Candidatus Heimdallarchaeota archaeon]